MNVKEIAQQKREAWKREKELEEDKKCKP